jgi:ketosteroid isomerase-like protein
LSESNARQYHAQSAQLGEFSARYIPFARAESSTQRTGGMNVRVLAFAAIVLGCSWGCKAADQNAQVMDSVQRFFDALGRQDKNDLLAVVAPNIEITSVQQNTLHRLRVEKLADAIAAHRGGPIAERIHQPRVHVDQDLAVVWAPYTFTIHGRVDHCGTDVLTLGKLQDRWVIIGLSDNERKDHCQ